MGSWRGTHDRIQSIPNSHASHMVKHLRREEGGMRQYMKWKFRRGYSRSEVEGL